MSLITEKIKNIKLSWSIKNGIWMYLLQFFNMVVPLLTLPYITRILGPSQYGEFSLALNLIGYLQVIVEYGFGMSATRKIAIGNRKIDEINKIFSCVITCRIILLLGCCIFYLFYLWRNINNPVQCICMGILLICLLGFCVQQNWLFQGLQEMRYISLINIISRTVSVVLIFLLVKEADDLFLYCLLYSISPLLSGFLGLVIVHKRYGVCFVRISLQDVRKEMKRGWHVFTTQLSSKVFVGIGITCMGIFATNREVGIYSAIQKLPNILLLAWTPISQVMYPVSSRDLQKSFIEGKELILKRRRIIFPFFAAIIMGTGIFSKDIIELVLGSEYCSYHYWVWPLLVWILVAINNNFLGIQILLGSGHDQEYSKCFKVGVICTVVLNFVFIFLWRGAGAAAAPLISESILGITLYKEVQRINKSVIT